MRHWLVRPELMCMQHRAGEHLETHMFAGAMADGRRLDGFYDGGLFFGPAYLIYRHNELAPHLEGHRSGLDYLVPGSEIGEIPGLRIDRTRYQDILPDSGRIAESLRTLISRCSVCLNLHLRAKREGRSYRYHVDHSTLVRLHLGSTDSKAGTRNT